MKFTLVHVSDIHYCKERKTTERVDALVTDLLAQNFQYPAHLVLSGDLTQAGSQRSFEEFYDAFVSKVVDKFQSVHLTPGNHDISRRHSDEAACDRILNAKDYAYLWSGNGRLSVSSPFGACDPLEDYFHLHAAVSEEVLSSYFGSISKTEGFSLLSLNSAWLSGARKGIDADKGKLRIDPPVINHFVGRMSDADFKIAMCHHPLSWLQPELQPHIEDLIGRNFDLFLCGHVHFNSTATAYSSKDGSCIFKQASASNSEYSHGSNCYSMIDIDSTAKALRIRHRSYAVALRRFIDGNDITDGAIEYPSPDHEAFWVNAEQNNGNGIATRLLETIDKQDMNDWYEANFEKDKTNIQFVEPDIIRAFSESRFEKRKPLSSVIDTDIKRLIIMGPSDSGLSTAAFLAGAHLVGRKGHQPTVPTYLNLKNVKINKASLEKQAARGAPIAIQSRDLQALVKSGQVTFLIDGISFSEVERFNNLFNTLDKYFPEIKAVVFVTANSQNSGTVTGSLNLDPNCDQVFEICELDLDAIEKLVESWQPQQQDSDSKTLTAKVVSSFEAMNEPIFPPTVILLLETLKLIPNYQPVNRVRLLDRYVECLLGRLDAADVRQGDFNSSDKIKFLSHLAAFFVQQKVYALSKDDLAEFCLHYSEHRLLELPTDLLEEFLSKGILVSISGKVTFRADYLFSYFIAREMASNKHFFSYLISEENFFSHLNEMTFYCELENTENDPLLDIVMNKLNEIEGLVVEAYQSEETSFENEWAEMLGGEEDSQASVDTARLHDQIREVVAEQPTDETIKSAMADNLVSTQRVRGVLARQDIEILDCRWLSLLVTYLQMIKHSASLSAEAKKQHIQRALKSSVLFMKGLSAKRDLLASHPVVLVNGILYINNKVAYDPEGARETIKFDIPRSMARITFNSLFNRQLAPVFLALDGNLDEPTSFLLSRLILGIQSREGRKTWMNRFEKELGPVLKTSSVQTLKGQYLGFSISKSDRFHHEKLIAELSKGDGKLSQSEAQHLKKIKNLQSMNRNT